MPEPEYQQTREYGFASHQAQMFPPMVVVEITNVCNLECIHCPYPFISKQEDYRPRHMDWALYEKIVSEVSQHPGTIFRLLCDGEPLCHPRFSEMLRLAKDKKIGPMNFITNGILLDEPMARTILETGIEAVEISLDALHKETYENIRKGSDFELVQENVHRLIALRDKHQARTKILVSIIDQPEVAQEKEAFVAYWQPRVDKVITRVYTTIGGLVNPEKLQIDVEGDRWPCPQLWRRLFVSVDGLAEFCVEDWHDRSALGDIHESSIAGIWQSPAYEQIRSSHLARQFEQVPYCQHCQDWRARDWDYNYFYALREVLKENGTPKEKAHDKQ